MQAVIDAIGSSHGGGKWKEMVLVDDRIADSIFQQIQTRPQEYSILATLNLNGDYISDAAAAMVGGLGMAPGANIGENAAIFEATHGTAPKHAGLDRINPGSVILSGVMMLEFLGWQGLLIEVTKGLENGQPSPTSRSSPSSDLAPAWTWSPRRCWMPVEPAARPSNGSRSTPAIACDLYGTYQYLPEDTLEAIQPTAWPSKKFIPVGGGIRSLNVALQQIFDLYSCVRPCRYYEGTPSPHKRPQDLDVIVYRENTEDIYMGVEWEADDAVGP